MHHTSANPHTTNYKIFLTVPLLRKTKENTPLALFPTCPGGLVEEAKHPHFDNDTGDNNYQTKVNSNLVLTQTVFPSPGYTMSVTFSHVIPKGMSGDLVHILKTHPVKQVYKKS